MSKLRTKLGQSEGWAQMINFNPDEELRKITDNYNFSEKSFTDLNNKGYTNGSMTKTTFTALPDQVTPEGLRTRRSRHFQRAGRLASVALLLTIAFLGFVVFVVGSLNLILADHRGSGVAALIGLGVFGIARLFSFLLSRSLTCPLCHGPVVHEKRCHKHSDAQRLPLMSYRGTVVLSVLFTLGFRCMYCGTPYRLRK